MVSMGTKITPIHFNDPNVAYILGYAWGDGHLYIKPQKEYYQMCLECSPNDLLELNEQCKSLKNYSDYYRPARYTRKNGEMSSYIRRTFYGKHLCLQLQEIGFKKKNTNHDKVLNKIPADLHYLFWRGLFDADGTAGFYPNNGTYGVSYCGPIDQDWTSVEKVFKKLNINYKITLNKCKTGKGSQIIIGGYAGVLSFKNYLYENNNSIGLRRKFNKLIQIQKQYEIFLEKEQFLINIDDQIIEVIKNNPLRPSEIGRELSHYPQKQIRRRVVKLAKEGKIKTEKVKKYKYYST